MSPYELLDIFSSAGEKLDSLWQFFVTVHLAIFGGLFIFHKLKRHQIVITIISYVAFSLINFRAKRDEYYLYEALISEIRKMDLRTKDLSFLSLFFSSYDTGDRIIIAVSVHIVAFLFLVFLLIKAKEPRRSRENLRNQNLGPADPKGINNLEQ